MSEDNKMQSNLYRCCT